MKIARIHMLVAAAAGAVCLTAPAVASAATVSVSQGVATYAASAGETNKLTLQNQVFWAGSYVKFSDTGASVQAGPGCIQASPSAVLCPAVKLTGISVDLGDGNDTLTDNYSDYFHHLGVTVQGGGGDDTIQGGAYPDTLDGGAGSDTINGGGGNDTILARDSAADSVACGAGDDIVTSDYSDTVASDCETVDASSPPAASVSPVGAGGATTGGTTTGGGGASLQGPPAAAPAVTITTAPAQVTTSGVVAVRLRCPKTAAAGCSGTLTVEILGGPNGKSRFVLVESRRRYKPKKAKRHFKLAAGKARFVSVHLDRRTWKTYRHRKNLRARITVTMMTAAGKVRSTRTVKLHAARRFDKKKKKKGRR